MQKPAGMESGIRWLPDHDVAQQRGRTDESGAERREVEWRNGVDEALQRAIFQLIPSASRLDLGLLREERPALLDIMTEEIDRLGRGVDLRLPDILALTQHSSCHEF